MSNPNEFVDLKEKKVNISGLLIQPSDVQPQTAHSSTNEVSLTSQKQYSQGKKPVTKRFATHPTLDNLNQLPNPTLTPEEKSKTKVPAATSNQSTKTFTEGPTVPLTDEANAREFGVDLKKNTSKGVFDIPANRYTRGTVKYTGVCALKCMVKDLPNFFEETGCIVDKTCVPGTDCYEENVHFVRRKCLGRGSFGEVSLCQDRKTRKQFVIKQVSKNKLRSSEIIVPSKLNHLNLTKFYGLIQRYYGKDKGNPTMELLLEYCGLAINKYYDQFGLLTDAQKWEVSKQGCAGLDHMSSNNIVHLDIKPENICIKVRTDGYVVVKLTDFGSSRLSEEPLEFVGLTYEYLAPEVCKMFLQRQRVRKFGLSRVDITGKVDVFAFGLVIMFLYKGYHILVKFITNGNLNYNGISKDKLSQMRRKLIELMADSSTDFVHDLIPDECDFKMKFLLRELTLLNHHDRFSSRQALGYIERIAKVSMESEKDPVMKTTKGAPSLSITEGNAPISLNNVSPQTNQMSEFTCIKPKVRKTSANNIDSLSRKATIKPKVSLKMPQKLAKEQEIVKQPAPTVQQEIRQKGVKEDVKCLTGQAKKMKTFANSPLQMDVQKENIKEEEEEESKGQALPNFSMLLSN